MTPTKISAGIMRPVRPSYRISFPLDRKPFSSRAFRIASSRSPLNGVPSMKRPSRDPTFPPICSRTWATVIRDGIAWGLMIRSGMIPCDVKGMSSCGAIRPITPFWPWRDANLSPSSGTRRSRTFTFASLEPFSLSVSMTESTQPLSPWRTVTDVSRRFCGVRKSVSSSRNRGGLVFPISTSPPWTSTSGEMRPSSGVRVADERLIRIVEQVAPGVRPKTVVARRDSKGLLSHASPHRDTRGRVVLRIGHDAGGDAQDDQRVDLDMGVGLRDRGLHAEILVAVGAFELRVLVPAPHVRPRDVVPAQGMLALLAPAGDVVRIEGDERVLFLLRVDPFHDPVPDEIREAEAPHLQLVDVLAGEHDVAFLHDQQGSSDAALVAVDDDFAHVLVEAQVHLVAQESRPPPFADLGDEEFRVLVEADKVSVHVDAGELGLLALDLLRAKVRQEEFHFLFREALRHVDHEGAVFDQAAVLPFRRLVRTEPTPLGRVQVPRLEMRLGSCERRSNPAKVAQGAHVRCAVEELGDPGATSDPIAGREGVEEPLGEQVRTNRRGDLQFPAARIGPLELVLEILHEVRERDPEQVFHEIAGELEPRVRIVILVVLASHAKGQLEDRPRDPTEEDRLL